MVYREVRVPLPGSERGPLPGAKVSGKLDPNQKIRVSVILCPSSPRKKGAALEALTRQSPQDRSYITRAQLASRYGAFPEDITAVEAFARTYGLDIVEESVARRTVGLSGTTAQVSEAFGVKLARYRHPRGIFRLRSGPIYLPESLAVSVQAVLGIDDRPQARSHFRLLRAGAGGVSYTPPEIAECYNFPKGLDGSGQSVALVELGGGYRTQDLQKYFSSLGISPPNVLSVSVDGATNSPTGDPSGPDTEVALDIEVVGSVASGADVYVYFAPNTDAGFVDAVTTAVNDTQHNPSVISISWGDAESSWSTQGVNSLEQALQDAALLGVTVTVASGDNGSSDGVADGLAHVDYPASSRYALGCGGTHISTTSNEVITSEVVWNDGTKGGASGGGISNLFPLPTWQDGAGVPPSANPGGRVGRGVPDVSADADPSSGYVVRADGMKFPVGGTSAVAPLWASLVALINQSAAGSGRKPAGYVTPSLYDAVSYASGAFHDITQGNNGAYSAGPGWDACTGLGSPNGAVLLQQILGSSPSKR